ncbi:MAG: ABC transporter ATP-binding protein [Cellulosilyticaceae bacterium]
MKKIIKNIKFILKESYDADKNFIYVSMMVHLIRLVEPLTAVLGIKLIMDTLTEGYSFYWIIIISVLYAALNITKGIIDSWYRDKYLIEKQVKIEQYLSTKLMRKIVSLDISVFDDASFYDKYTRAVNELNTRSISVITNLCEITGCIFSIAALTAVILAIEPFLIICVFLAVAISMCLDLFKSKILYGYDRELTPFQRKLSYIKRIFYEPQYAKEMRLFDMSKLSLDKYNSNANQLAGILRRQGKIKFLLSALQRILEKSIFEAVALLYISYRVFIKALTIGDFSAMFTAVFQFGNEIYNLLSKFPTLYQHSLFIDNFIQVLEYETLIEKGGTLELDQTCSHTIEFREVSFGYKNGRQILKKVNLKINAGEKVAIVGYNGAGKSTLIKLMTRLYDADEGDILIDGIDIREYSTPSLRKAFGVVMQDFQHYAFSIAENLCPEFSKEQDETRIQEVIRVVGLEKRIGQLDKGIYSSVTREFEEDGAVFSGGEFQKLSFARAYISNAPMLILDEVSSALDPVAEHEMNEMIMNKVEDKTVIFISHRLTSAKMADKIYMLEKGTVVESGNHQELMQQEGKYAYFFNLQGKKYA